MKAKKKKKAYAEQLMRSNLIQHNTGYSVCTCGNCGAVRLINLALDTKQTGPELGLLPPCYNCGERLQSCECPDIFY